MSEVADDLCGDPLRVTVGAIPVGADLGGKRRRRSHDDARFDLQPGAASVVEEVRIEREADQLPIVGVEVLPSVHVRACQAAGTAARQSIVETTAVDVEPAPEVPEILKLPVCVDVAADVPAIAAEIVGRPLIEVEVRTADVLVRRVPPYLEPAVLQDRVGPLLEPEVVDV